METNFIITFLLNSSDMIFKSTRNLYYSMLTENKQLVYGNFARYMYMKFIANRSVSNSCW